MELDKKTFSSALFRFYFSVIFGILASIVLVFWLAGNPVRNALGNSLRSDFAQDVQLANLTVSNYIDGCMRLAKQLSGSPFLIEVIAQYQAGLATKSGLIRFNELDFQDRISTIGNIESAVRVIGQK